MGEMFAFSNICRFSYINSHTRKQINTLLPKIKVFHFLLLRMFKLFCFSSDVDTNGSSHPVGHWDYIPATNPLVKWWAITQEQSHRSTTPKLATPTAPPCMDNIIHTLWSSRGHEPGCDAPVGNHSITRGSGTRRFHPRVAGRQVSPRGQVTLQDTRDSGPSNGRMVTCPIDENRRP